MIRTILSVSALLALFVTHPSSAQAPAEEESCQARCKAVLEDCQGRCPAEAIERMACHEQCIEDQGDCLSTCKEPESD